MSFSVIYLFYVLTRSSKRGRKRKDYLKFIYPYSQFCYSWLFYTANQHKYSMHLPYIPAIISFSYMEKPNSSTQLEIQLIMFYLQIISIISQFYEYVMLRSTKKTVDLLISLLIGWVQVPRKDKYCVITEPWSSGYGR